MRLLAITTIVCAVFAGFAEAGPRVIGGTKARISDKPWLGALVDRRVEGYYSGYICGAVLVRPRWALTAAHCLRALSAQRLALLFGARDLRKKGSLYLVKKKKVHPRFGSGMSYDLVLLQMRRSRRGPVSLHRSSQTRLRVAGWGWQGERMSPVLLQARMSITDTCQKAYYGLFEESNMLCAQGVGQSVCGGDSGSPLYSIVAGRAFVHGVVSWGEVRCSRFPGVYARTDLPWINSALRAEIK